MKQAHLVAAFFCSLFLLGCKPKSEMPTESSPLESSPSKAVIPPTEKVNVNPQSGVPTTNTSSAIGVSNTGLTSEAFQVITRSNRAEIVKSVHAMETILQAWDVIGQKTSALEKLIGPPDEASSTNWIYRFDSGLGGNEWIFDINNDLIIKVARKSLD